MPLYINDEQIENTLGTTVAFALKAIKTDMQHHSVTPSLALGLIKRHLQPLMPEADKDILDKLIQVTWDDLHWAYPEIIFRGGQPTGLLADIGVSIDLICRYTTNPPREFLGQETVEVGNFLLLCEHLNIRISDEVRYTNNRKFDVFNTCKYCWRQPVPGRLICSSHTAGDKHSPVELGAKNELSENSPSANYKESKRQKPFFDEFIKSTLSREIWEFHESGFSSPTLIPSQNIFKWLLDRRPHVANLLTQQDMAIDDDKIVDSLLFLLHSPEGYINTQLEPYQKTNFLIKTNPVLIWPMLLRAEAWLHARKTLRSNWGGNRIQERN